MKDSLSRLVEPTDSIAVAISESLKTFRSMSGEEILDVTLDTVTRWGLKVIAAIVIYFIGAWLIRRVKKLLQRVFVRRKVEASLASFTSSFTSISLNVLLIVIIVSILGVPTSTFAALLAAGGMAIGMALSGTLQNFAGGIMILIFKPFKVGDYIEAGGYEGVVDAINITTTQIHTYDNLIIFLPNGSVSNKEIKNYTMAKTRRATWKVNIDYSEDSQKVIDALLKIVKSDPRVLTDPAPYAVVSELLNTEGCITVMVRGYTVNDDTYWDVLWDMNKKIHMELPGYNINFEVPNMKVRIEK